MKILKKLVKGELSLAVTFWGFGVLSSLILGLILFGIIIIFNAYRTPFFIRDKIIISIFIIDFIITCLVLIGLFNILKNGKLTFWKVIAFVVWLCSTIYLIYDYCCNIIPYYI